jgi:proteasome accessory factor C
MSESAGSRLARLLTLVPWLMAHDGVTIQETAAHFGVTEADLERDLWLLVVSGLPGHGPDQLVDIDFWDDGVIHVLDPQTLDRPLRLTPEEAVTLLISLRTLAQVPGIEDRMALHGAMAKIESALGESYDSGSVPDIDLRVSSDVGRIIDEALLSTGGLHITYLSGTRDDVTSRLIAPLQVDVVDGVAYLEAWCSMAEGVRTFRLDRIIAAEPADRPSTPAQESPVTELPRRQGASEWAIIAVDASDRWIADVHSGATVEGMDDQGRTLIRLPLHSEEWGVGLVLGMGGSATVVSPPELVTAVAARAASAAAAYPDDLG